MTGELRVNYKKILKVSLSFALIIIGVLLGIKVAIFFLPFLIAFIISKIIRKPVEFLNRKFKLPKILGVIITILIFMVAVGLILYFLGSALFNEVMKLYNVAQRVVFPEDMIKYQIGRFKFFFDSLNIAPEIVTEINKSLVGITENIFGTITSWINKAGTGLMNVVVNFPIILIYVIITILSTFFISCDHKYISESLEKYLPLKWLKKAADISNGLFSSLGSYLKAIGILISITFCELLIGFWLFDIEYAVVLAIVIAIIDALPILGTGTVLIPWGIILLVTGNIPLGLGMLGLYLIILVIRQLIEPKVVGHQIGVYPLLTLIAMYTGVRFFGLSGVIIGPIVLIILKNVLSSVYEKGVLKELFEN